jgi:hypothetical protein
MDPALMGEEPTPEFRARLEWQIQTALRRETRFSEPTAAPRPRARTALLVVAALVIGGAVGWIPGYAQESQERSQLVQNAQSEASLIQLRLELVQKELEQTRRRADVGLVGPEALSAAEDQVRALETALKRNQLDQEEIRATSAAPRNDLQAPLVGQRDFVRERLMLDLANAQRALAAAEQKAAAVHTRHEVGLVEQAEVQRSDLDVEKARTDMQLLAARLDLRRRALQGDIKAEDVAPTLHRQELQLQLRQLQRELELSQTRLANVRRLIAVGIGSEVDVKQAELQILEQQGQMVRLQQQLQALSTKK